MVRRLLITLLAAAALAVAALLAGIRFKYPPVVGFVRRNLRDRVNPQALATAGQAGDSRGAIVHTGRRSGRTFRTPITPMPMDDGFLIALPYGPDSDWVLNVLAAGSATVITNGEEVPVDQPEVRPIAEYQTLFPASGRAGMRVFGVTDCLVVHQISD